MIGGVLKKVFGSANDRMLARLKGEVDAINAFEPKVQKLSDEALKAQTDKFRERIKAGETLDTIMVEAFATVREAAVRTLGQRHFDVQLLGGMVLHKARSPKCAPAKVKPLSRRYRST